MQIRVPASSANFGPGFDSIGVALNEYLNLAVLEPTSTWEVEHDLPHVPHDEQNLIIKAALTLVPDLTPHHLLVQSKIPLAHGLGSSSTAIVAGIELANQLADLKLSPMAKVQLAAQIEGHPDNVAPAVLGGVVIGTNLRDQFITFRAPTPPFAFLAYVPKYNLATSTSRSILPTKIERSTAVQGSSAANALVAALFSQQYEMLGALIEGDQFHEAARAKLVPELTKIRQIGHEVGAVATYLSGAGPTVMTLIEPKLIPAFQNRLLQVNLTAPLHELAVDQTGVIVTI